LRECHAERISGLDVCGLVTPEDVQGLFSFSEEEELD